MAGKLEGKVAIITGGAGALGRSTAELFLQEGAKVALVDINQNSLASVVESLGSVEEAHGLAANLSDEEDVKRYVKHVMQKWGRIDVFFNNAGIIGKVAPLTDQTVEDFEAIMDINVRGVFLGLKHILPIMSAQKSGSVINTSSVSGLMGSSGNSLYSASKHAVVGLTKTAALEVAKDSVRVNSVHPAPLDSAMMKVIEQSLNIDNPSAVRTHISSRIPLGRYGSMEEVSKLVLFLASDDSKFITGSQYRIDGGMGAR
ncbi:SDR family NAD(P)-dependent oxidoreductase [Planococcus salinarum]|uniref:SDR family NAD(P)-dependent oxidoreductase n=1 Tax=Planococcus salinarum TaxID=622695 RepID=UPI000E3DC9A6|nr:SDR family NAD(P)-dependent oxidoreductase [Planococcus salinarum]TAA72569.1 SDR family oxidoreductase [Planococcus salinarum]